MLKDGTVVEPPEIIGLYSVGKEYQNFNLVYKNKDGKINSHSGITKYTLTPTKYSEEFLYSMSNDEISGKGIKYDLKKKVYSNPVTVKDGAIEFIYPITNEVSAYFKGDKFTATRLEGTYIDNWIKVK